MTLVTIRIVWILDPTICLDDQFKIVNRIANCLVTQEATNLVAVLVMNIQIHRTSGG
jgi:hypothetical protein